MTEDQDLEGRRRAHRQAGYVVTLYAQGERLPDLSLDREAAPPVPEAEETPRWWGVALGSRTRHRTELDILARWAGLVAEARACWEGTEPPGGWGEMLAPIATLGRRVTRDGEENEAYLEWLRRRAAGLLSLPDIRAAVEAVAEALLTHGRLPSRRVSEIIAGVQRIQRRGKGLAAIFRSR